MKNKLILTILLASIFLAAYHASAQTIKVAVIDTGFDFKSLWGLQAYSKFKFGLTMPKLCPGMHKDFTREEDDSQYLKDNAGHGTHIAGLIAKEAKDADYCLLILKYYDPMAKTQDHLGNLKRALQYAIEQHVDIINYSGGGIDPNKEEFEIVEKALKQGIRFVAASGNEGMDLSSNGIGFVSKDKRSPANNKPCGYYPACYDIQINIIGNVFDDGKKGHKTNYGSAITEYIKGMDVYSLLPNNAYGQMSGTSQAAGIKTGTLIREFKEYRNYDKVDVGGFNSDTTGTTKST